MISYNNITMRTKHVQQYKYNHKTKKSTELKKPIVTYTNHIVVADAYDLGTLYKMMDYASEVGHNVEVTFNINKEY
jgi:hypothetical protein